MDFYDMKGILAALLDGLHIQGARFEAAEHPTFHPGKCARLLLGDQSLGVLGELHPLVSEHYDLPAAPLLAAEIDLQALIDAVPERYDIELVPSYPPVLEDLAVIVDEDLPAERILGIIQQAGGKLLVGVRLFDVYHGEQIGAGKKSLAYSLAYQSPERTLTDNEVLQVRQRILRRLEQELGAKLRS